MRFVKFGVTALALFLAAGMATADLADRQKELEAGPGSPSRDLLDCTYAVYAPCGYYEVNNNGNGAANVTYYSCVGYAETGPEMVYEVYLDADYTVTIEVNYYNPGTQDLDLFLMTACDENTCIDYSGSVSGYEVITANLTAGTYYVTVDGYNGSVDDYDITITCEGAVPPPPGDTCDDPLDLACGDIYIVTDTCPYNNDYDPGAGNPCTGYSAAGLDYVYALTIPDGGYIDLEFSEDGYDGSIYLITDCDDIVGTCLSGDDCYPWPCVDYIYYMNTTGSDVDAYLIIDGYGTDNCGIGTLAGFLSCGGSASESTTWGQVKSYFR
jgi:hypothetical protein